MSREIFRNRETALPVYESLPEKSVVYMKTKSTDEKADALWPGYDLDAPL